MRISLQRNENGRRELVLQRVEPLEGTAISLWNTEIPNWWAANMNTAGWMPGSAELAERVWVANRCIQLNAQQIAGMPLIFHGSDRPPRWLSSPDPNWYPNGIGDALHAMVEQYYGYGFTCQYVTDFYADGFPRTWTVLDSAALNIKAVDGQREYKYGEQLLDPRRVIQIDRNPGVRVHGTSALRSYAQLAWGFMAASNQAMTVSQGGIPAVALKALKKIDAEQALALQNQWMEATQRRNGAPPVLPPDLEFEKLSFSPEDLALLGILEFDAQALAAAFGVPAMLLNMVLQGGLAYQNPGQLGEMWWRFELRPTSTRFANAFSAQMLPEGQWVSFDAADTFAELSDLSDDDDEQASQVAKASPSQQPRPLTAVGGGP